MHLDRRQPGQLERIADRVGVVRPGAGVEHDPVGKPVQTVKMLDELAFVVGLKEASLQSELGRRLVDLQLELLRVTVP